MKVTKQKINKLSDRAGVSEEVAIDALERADGDLLDAVILLEKEGKLGSAPEKNGTSWSSSSSVPAVYDENTDFIMKDSPSDSAGDGASQEAQSKAAEPDPQPQSQPKPEDFVGGPPPGGYYGQQNTGGNAYGSNAYGSEYNSQSSYGYNNNSASGTASSGGAQNGPNGNYNQQQYYYDQKTGTYKYRDESTQFEDGAMRFGRALLSILRGTVVNHFEIWYKGGRLFHFPIILFILLFVPWIFWVSLVTLVIGLACGWRYRFSGPHLGRKDGNE